MPTKEEEEQKKKTFILQVQQNDLKFFFLR